jgi:hypothetical protein
MTATPSTVASASIPSTWTPGSTDASSLHNHVRSTVGADTATATTTTVRSQLSPTNKTAERRQMLITSLFPRASFSVQDSTGIADITFPNMENEQARETGARGQMAATQAAPRPQTTASRAMPPGRTYPADAPLHESDVEYDDSADVESAEGDEDSLDEGESEGSESDDESSGDEEDAGETRTNPSASQQSFSSSSSCSDAQEADSTSVGADDELPQSHVHSHVHPHAYASAGGHQAQSTSSHYLPRVAAQHSPAREGKRAGGNSESDEGGDFYENMKKFLQGFQESQLIDISDSEMDMDMRIQMVAHNTAATALQAKRRAASQPTKAPASGAGKGKGKAARKVGRTVSAGIAEAKSTARSSR